MVRKIKEAVQNKLNSICYEKYRQEVERQKDSYRQWYLKKENWKKKAYRKSEKCALVLFQDCKKGCLPSSLPEAEILLFADGRGVLEEKAPEAVGDFFDRNPHVVLAYGDEDCMDSEGKRHSPWFKPCWSPDTLASFQYFGHVFAIKRELLETLSPEAWAACMAGDFEENIYKLLLTLTEIITKKRFIKANDAQKEIESMGMVLLHMTQKTQDTESKSPEKVLWQSDSHISIIIPSKDNPEVLRTCLTSLREKTAGEIAYEIIVVDNGSSEINKKTLEEMAETLSFQYLYMPMPFNFSTMCNLGAKKAAGDFLLFLNDDMEIIQPDWLFKLWEKARLGHVGAVGAKLLYPESRRIQHIGITNIKVGPVHKLLKQTDEKEYYHGQNRHVYDMIGVTAACLLLETKKFWEAGGFYEGMAVSYNDVDFCFTLHEMGLYNVVRCDVALYHHESLSRGDDNLSDEKWIRLLKEKDILYTRHPGLKGKDPFYSPNLAVHSNLYLSNFRYDFEKRDYYTALRARRKPVFAKWENGCLIVNPEHAREEKKLEFTERDDVYWIEGWSYVLGMDNCRYRRSLLLYHESGACYQAELLSRYRKDVADILFEQQNTELAGFVCRIPKELLPFGRYQIAMLAEDKCSGQKLYAKTETEFYVSESEKSTKKFI